MSIVPFVVKRFFLVILRFIGHESSLIYAHHPCCFSETSAPHLSAGLLQRDLHPYLRPETLQLLHFSPVSHLRMHGLWGPPESQWRFSVPVAVCIGLLLAVLSFPVHWHVLLILSFWLRDNLLVLISWLAPSCTWLSSFYLIIPQPGREQFLGIDGGSVAN